MIILFTDFNVVRNRVYNINARILGMNTVDWRVSTAEVAVTPLAESYRPGASAAARLELVSTNDAENDYYLSYHLDAGQGIVTIDGGAPYGRHTLSAALRKRHGDGWHRLYTRGLRRRAPAPDRHG